MNSVPFLLHFEPSEEPAVLMGDVARGLAAKGYPVLPGRPHTKQAHWAGLKGSCDPSKIAQWWGKHPEANPLVHLQHSRMVVLDVDSQEGEESLVRLAALAGGFPPTLQVRTYRGRHLWFLLGDRCEPLTSQPGTGGPHPGLDVKMTGVMAAPGARHPKGGSYEPLCEVPDMADLAVLPVEVYEALAAVGRPRQKPAARGTRPRPVAASQGLSRPPASPIVGRELAGLLNDTSDGRDSRTLTVVRLLRDRPDAEIKRTLMAYPLGGKASEQSNPDRYLQGKIDWLRKTMDTDAPAWERVAFWEAARHAVLGSAELRVLLALIRCGGCHGRVRRGLDLIGIDSACSPARVSEAITSLVSKGWLLLLDEPPRWERIPRTFRLTIPQEHAQILNTTAPQGAPPHPPTTPPALNALGVQFLSRHCGHDAFRSAKGSLNSAFPLLCLLGSEPASAVDLTARLGMSRKTVTRHLVVLLEAGLALRTDAGYAGCGDDSGLSAVAQRAGTVGKRTQAIQTYEAKKRADQEARRQWQEEIHTVGSPTWTHETRRYYAAAVTGPGFSALRQCWQGDGLTDLDLVAYLVEQEVAAHTTVPDWDINTIDVKDAAPFQGVGG